MTGQSEQLAVRDPGLQQVHVWVLNLERHRPETMARHEFVLDAEEQRRAGRFSSLPARLLYCVTRTVVRKVLSFYRSEVDPARWAFARNAHGKPVIAEPRLSPPLFFNVSHCDGRLVMAVSRWREIGVDVEKVTTRHSLLSLARRYFLPAEYEHLCDLAPDDCRQTFFTLWTLKEAYSKARGATLVPSLAQLGIELPGAGGLAVSFAGGENDDPRCWQFWLYNDENFPLALAQRRDGQVEPMDCVIRELEFPLCPGEAVVSDLSPVRRNC